MEEPTHNNGDPGRQGRNWSRRLSTAALILLTTLLILYVSCLIRPQDHPNDVFYEDLRDETTTNGAEAQPPTTDSDSIGEAPTTSPTPPSTIDESGIVAELELGAATATVGQRIYASDVVVRVSLLSTSEGSLRFRAVEYLKGSGPSEFMVNASTANRNTVWDGREAVLFLSRPSSEGASGASGSNDSADFQFVDTTQGYSGDLPQGYTVDSRNPVWLPAETMTEGASGASSDGSTFITASASPNDGSQPVISLADLRSKIAWIGGGERASQDTTSASQQA